MKAVLFVLVLGALSQAPDFDSAVMLISGASCMEELDESTLERFRALSLHPVDLNGASRSRLLATGLMSAFQVASLIDWRTSSGDILSYSELALIYGFNEEYAAALKLFTRLESSGAPGERRRGPLRHEVMIRSSARTDLLNPAETAAGMKYRASLGETVELNWSTRTTYSSHSPGIGTVSAALYGRRKLGKLVLGHFNARFGQGQVLWSGFAMQPYGSVTSFRKSGTGFSPTGSFSAEFCGAAADFEFGRWNVAAAYSFKEQLPMAALSYCSRWFTAGATCSGKAFGADFKLGLRNLALFGEAAWRGEPALAAGLIWVPAYGSKTGLLCRWTGGPTEVLAGASLKSLEAVASYSAGQQRCFIKYCPELHAGPVSLAPSLRLAAKHTQAWRLESRGELRAGMGPATLNCRLDVVKCKAPAWLCNAEAGYVADKLKCWLRWTLFCVDNWDDRIYVYERDAPGSFNVPAYYGRGWAMSFAGAWRPHFKHRVYWRVSYIAYPWMTTEKPQRFEVKLQYNVSIR